MKVKHSASFKAKAAIEALKEHKSMNELSSEFGVHRIQIQNWKKLAKVHLEDAFSSKREKNQKDQSELLDNLYKQIGILKVENEWLKKKLES